jgi:membrane AbrB-like protein
VGFGVVKIADMNLSTALLATAPGGVSDMALIADDLGADMQTVSIMQLFRLFAVYLIFPPLLRLTQKTQDSKINKSENVDKEKPQKKDKRDIKNCVLTVIIAFAGGYVLERTGIPAGYMVGSVVACAIFNIASGKGCIPNSWRFYIQSITGAIIGCTMTQESLKLLGQLALPIVLMVIGMIVSTYVFAAIMARVSELDFQTSLLCLTPGGIQETSLLADDLGCDTMSVVVMHTIRLVIVICIFPTLFSLFSIF